jgi:hypothetical protein
MHVAVVQDTIKKRGHFKDYEKAERAYDEAKQAIELVKEGLAQLNGTSGGKKNCKKKALAKAKEAAMEAVKEAVKEAPAKDPSPKSEAKEAEEAPKVNNNTMRAGFQVDLAKAKQAQKIAKGVMTAATSKMFAFYLNLLSPESKYLWNKIVSKQTESNPFVNLQGISLEGPRGMSCVLFNGCIMFHLLTALPINAAEQEKYYVTNVLKKPQHVNVPQFVHRVEQLNAYIAQMPCSITAPTLMPAPSPRTSHSWRLS